MNTWMWKHPATKINLFKVKSFGTIDIIPPIAKRLMCGDIGIGAMEEPSQIAKRIKEILDAKDKCLCLTDVVSTVLAIFIFGNLGRGLYRILRS